MVLLVRICGASFLIGILFSIFKTGSEIREKNDSQIAEEQRIGIAFSVHIALFRESEKSRFEKFC